MPTGYIIINGHTTTTQRFCDAIQGGKPVFIFRHTGDSADLICEALKEAREFAKQRHNNPKARAKRPFEVTMTMVVMVMMLMMMMMMMMRVMMLMLMLMLMMMMMI